MPDELFALTQLTSLKLTNNTQLDGALSSDNRLARLSKLETLEAGYTQLQGTLSPGMFASLTALQTFRVPGAALSGPLPEELALWNASLQTLWLQDNKLTGTLPTALDALTALVELKLEGNDITGNVSQSLCSRRGERFQELAVLTVDCAVGCSCCDFYEENCG